MFIALSPGYAEQDDNPARMLLAKTVDAVGGEKKSCEWKTRIDTGIMKTAWPGWGDLRAKCTLSVKKPDKLKLDQDYSAYDHPFFFIHYYNGGEAWYNVNLNIRQTTRTTRLMTNKMKRIDGPSYFLTKCDTFFLVTDVPDDSLFIGSDIDRIGVVDDGDTVFIDVDKKTHLPVRRIQDGGTTHVILGDYKPVDGIVVPFLETVFQDGQKTEYIWEDIKFNVTIDDAIFEEDRPRK
jgi:hypothetical protein